MRDGTKKPVWKALLPRPREERGECGIDASDIDGDVVGKVCEGLRSGQVGVLPTETVYGLMGCAQSDAVVDRIYALKARDRGKPLPVQVRSLEEVVLLGADVNSFAQILARNFWPGPLTLVLPFFGAGRCRAGIAPALLTQWSQKGTLAVRVPDHPFMQMVLRDAGMPLIATSANVSNEEPVTRLNQLDKGLKEQVDWMVDGGASVYRRESSVVLCDREGWRILREGALRGVVIEKALR